MAERRRTPRSYFGLSATPQSGLQEPALSPGMQQRFDSAGLSSFLPYVNPWETVARSQDYRAAENQFQVQDAEDRFIQRLQADPAAATTGLQKFLAEDPRLISSPMFRAYAVTQERLAQQQKPKTDPYALDAAEAGKEFLDQYNKDIASGVPQLDAFAAHRSRLAEAKKKSPEDDRLTLSGTPKEEFDNLMAEYVSAQDAEPTDEQKMAFLPPGKKEYTPREWSDAYYKAKAAAQDNAVKKIERFQQVYGDFYKLPQRVRREAAAPAVPTSPTEQVSVEEQQVQTPAGTTTAVEEQVTPKRDTGFNFPTLGQDLPPSTFETATGTLKKALSNIAGNVARDPIGTLANFDAQKRRDMIMNTPPTKEDDRKAWESAKQTVRDYLDRLPAAKDAQQRLKMLGSIVAEEDVPIDSYWPKRTGMSERLRAGNALEGALKLYSGKELPEHALKDADGTRGWDDVAKVVAQEELAKQGLIQSPEGSTQPASVTQVTTVEQYNALPSGTPYVDSKGRRAVKK